MSSACLVHILPWQENKHSPLQGYNCWCKSLAPADPRRFHLFVLVVMTLGHETPWVVTLTADLNRLRHFEQSRV